MNNFVKKLIYRSRIDPRYAFRCASIYLKYSLFPSLGKNPFIVVAGLGRCGTTLVYENLEHPLEEKKYLKEIHVKKVGTESIVLCPSFEMITNSMHSKRFSMTSPVWKWKNHDYPPELLDKRFKVIFLFGEPKDIIISCYEKFKINPGFKKLHCRHLGVDFFEDNKLIFKKDVLRLEKLFDAWMEKQNFNCIKLKYEKLYDNIDILEDFLKIKFKLPEKIERRSNWKKSPYREYLIKTYASLSGKVDQAQAYEIDSI